MEEAEPNHLQITDDCFCSFLLCTLIGFVLVYPVHENYEKDWTQNAPMLEFQCLHGMSLVDYH